MGVGSIAASKIIGIVVVVIVIVIVGLLIWGWIKNGIKGLNPLNWFKDGGIFKDTFKGGVSKAGKGLKKAGNWLKGKGNPLWQDELHDDQDDENEHND